MKKLKKIFKHSFVNKLFAKIARRGEISEAIQALTFAELIGVIITTIALFICSLILVVNLVQKETIIYPDYGGTLNEGVVGEPNLFNPLLSVRDEDQEIVSLIFSGLLRKNNDTYINDLAESVTKSKDFKSVTVKLKPDLKFHNGDILNADDVVFTINLIKDPYVKSPLKVLWDSVVVTKKDDLTVVFSLKQSYGFFDDMLTLGIVSEDIFKDTPREEFPTLKEHQKPIGAGPYKFVSAKTNDDKIYEINLKRFRKHDPKPFIKKINISYYKDEDSLLKAFKRGDINIASGVSPQMTEKQNNAIINSQLNRNFAIFINRKNVTYSPKTIEALNELIPRELIVSDALNNMGKPIYYPYPLSNDMAITEVKERVSNALKLLETDGWKHLSDGTYAKDGKTLDVSITSPDTAELRDIGDRIVTAFREVGVSTEIKYINPTMFTENIIRQREFDFVLFGQVLHTPADLYAFWHSSQKNDPGLNIGSYANKSVDTKLESLLKETDPNKQKGLINDINNLVKNDTGALFIFAPKYIILSDKKTTLNLPEKMSYSKDRYQNVYQWSIEKKRILKFLNK